MRRAGLAAERTALAWRRTALGAMVTAVLLLNHSIANGRRPATIASLGAVITMAAVACLCYLRNRGLREGRRSGGGVPIAATTVAVVAVACVAVAIGFLAPRT